jgi:hypothetical protein
MQSHDSTLMYPARMPYQTAITVKTTLDRIWKHDYVLPAIQREFVWNPQQICKLFDSLMQGFPVGSFLFWKIEPATFKSFRFFDFSREYHQRDNPHCPPLGNPVLVNDAFAYISNMDFLQCV